MIEKENPQAQVPAGFFIFSKHGRFRKFVILRVMKLDSSADLSKSAGRTVLPAIYDVYDYYSFR